MAASLNSASLQLVAQGNVTSAAGTQTLDATSARTPQISKTLSFTNGTSANQATLLYSGSRTLAGTSETLDLTSTFKDEFGNTIDFSTQKIKAIAIYNTDTTSGHVLKVGGAATTQWANFGTPANLGPFSGATDIAVIGAGGVWCAASPVDGFGVDSTHKSLKVDAGANTITYQIIMWG